MNLRSYQVRAVEGVSQAFRSGSRAVCLVAPTGAGKTVLGLEVVRRTLARDPARRVLWIAHRTELIQQAMDRAESYLGADVSRLTVETVQSLTASGRRPAANLMVWDECFIAGTAVTMWDGSKRAIETVVPGDEVLSFDPTTKTAQRGVVTRRHQRTTSDLVNVSLSNGESVTCTGSHRWLTQSGRWVEAHSIRCGEALQSPDGTHINATVYRVRGAGDPLEPGEEAVLLQGLPVRSSSQNLVRDDGADESKVRIRTDDEPEPNGERGHARSDEANADPDWTRATHPGWQRQAAAIVAEESACRSGRRMEDGTRRVVSDVARERVADALQDRLSQPEEDDCGRDRRPLALPPCAQGAGCEEDALPRVDRVVGVPVHESAGSGEYGSDRDVPVFDLTVEPSHTYVVGGAVVHNCHHAGEGAAEWNGVAQDYARSWRLGLTATPQRGDGTPLGDVFDSLVVAAQYSELLADGHLVPCRVIRPDGPIEDGLAQNPVEAWKAHAGDRQGFIFGHRVDKCYEYARALTAAGFPTEVIEGNTAADIRAEHLREFKAGRLRALCSVYVLTEGIDVPVASVCLLARKAGHTGTYLQMVGRVLRPAPGKTDALLIDLAGTSYHHGLPTDDREYALSGRSIRTLGQVREAAEESEKRADKPLVIYSRELREVYAGDETPVEARRAEWNRLVDLCQQRKWAIGWAAKQYRTLFKAPPPATWVPPAMRAAQVQAWKARASEKSYKPGWVRVMEREAFG